MALVLSAPQNMMESQAGLLNVGSLNFFELFDGNIYICTWIDSGKRLWHLLFFSLFFYYYWTNVVHILLIKEKTIKFTPTV